MHTDEPGAALALGNGRRHARAGRDREHAQADGAARGAPAARGAGRAAARSEVVAVVAGAGNRALFESSGATQIVEGGQSMNPSAAELVAAIDRARAPSVFVLPNNSNVILAAEQAAELSDEGRPRRPHRLDPRRARRDRRVRRLAGRATRTPRRWRRRVASVATGAVTIASKDAQLNGLAIRKGNYLGLARRRAGRAGRELRRGRGRRVRPRCSPSRAAYVTLLKGADEPGRDGARRRAAKRSIPTLELEVHEGGQPHYPLLVSAA